MTRAKLRAQKAHCAWQVPSGGGGGGVGGALLLSHVAIRSELVPVALVSWCPGITEGGLASLGINLTLCISYLTK